MGQHSAFAFHSRFLNLMVEPVDKIFFWLKSRNPEGLRHRILTWKTENLSESAFPSEKKEILPGKRAVELETGAAIW